MLLHVAECALHTCESPEIFLISLNISMVRPLECGRFLQIMLLTASDVIEPSPYRGPIQPALSLSTQSCLLIGLNLFNPCS